MRYYCSLILLFAFSGASFGAELPTGAWTRTDGGSKVRIQPCGKSFCATNTFIRDPQSDEKVGDVLVMTLEDKGDALSGTAFDKRRNKSYNISVSVNNGSMNTRGCILGGLLCKGVAWTKAN
jgi:uncharacterized protein (DUF2147 family)